MLLLSLSKFVYQFTCDSVSATGGSCIVSNKVCEWTGLLKVAVITPCIHLGNWPIPWGASSGLLVLTIPTRSYLPLWLPPKFDPACLVWGTYYSDWHLILLPTPLTPCQLDGLLIKYPQFPDILNTLNVQPHNLFLLTVWHCRLCSWAPDCRNCILKFLKSWCVSHFMATSIDVKKLYCMTKRRAKSSYH